MLQWFPLMAWPQTGYKYNKNIFRCHSATVLVSPVTTWETAMLTVNAGPNLPDHCQQKTFPASECTMHHIEFDLKSVCDESFRCTSAPADIMGAASPPQPQRPTGCVVDMESCVNRKPPLDHKSIFVVHILCMICIEIMYVGVSDYLLEQLALMNSLGRSTWR